MKKECPTCRTVIELECHFEMGEIRNDRVLEPCNVCAHNELPDDNEWPCNFCTVPRMKSPPL